MSGRVSRQLSMPVVPVQFSTVKSAAEKREVISLVRMTDPACDARPSVTLMVRNVPLRSDSR